MFIIKIYLKNLCSSDQNNLKIPQSQLENIYCADHIKLLFSFISMIFFVFDQSCSILMKTFNYK